MAGVTKVNGKYHTEELVHRDLFFKNIKVTAGEALNDQLTQAEFDALMQEVALTSTIEVIGLFNSTEDVGTPTNTTSDGVNIVISGADVTTLDGGAMTAAITDIAGF